MAENHKMSRQESLPEIAVGLGSLEGLMTLADAGADEVFCGYVPLDWQLRFGQGMPLNRREVRYYQVNIGSYEQMRLLAVRAKALKVRVSITFNSLYYTKEQLPVIASYIKELNELGFEDYIIADLGLLLYLKAEKIPCKVHISGEFGEWNSPTIRLLGEEFGGTSSVKISRIIFHRKNSLAQMEKLMPLLKEEGIEAEAFVLNEMCHYSGAFCNSMHCDEMSPLCRVDYSLCDGHKIYENQAEDSDSAAAYHACGLCALWRFREIGIKNVKIVGRGKYWKYMIKDVKLVKEAIAELDNCRSEEAFIHLMKEKQKEICGQNCYYRELL